MQVYENTYKMYEKNCSSSIFLKKIEIFQKLEYFVLYDIKQRKMLDFWESKKID